MSENKTNYRIKNNRLRQLKCSIISSNQQTGRHSKYIRNKKRLPFNMVVSETAYRSNPCTDPMLMKNVNLSEYDEIFSNVNQKPQSDIAAELRKSMMMWNPKETVFEKRLDDVRECRSKLREECGIDDDSNDDGINEYFGMNNIREENAESSFPMKTERLLKSFKSFETKRIDDVRVELNGLKVIKVFEYKETSFSGVFGDGFKFKNN